MRCRVCTQELATYLLTIRDFSERKKHSPDAEPKIIASAVICEQCIGQVNDEITEAVSWLEASKGKWRGKIFWNYNSLLGVDDRKKNNNNNNNNDNNKKELESC